MRSKAEDLDVDFDKAKPANISYAHDYNGDADVWSATGIVAARYQFAGKFKTSITGSVAFDRVTNSADSSKERNSLIPRIGGGLILEGDAKFIQLHQFRASAAYGTDFDLESKVPALELEYEPTIFAIAAGVAHPVGEGFYYCLSLLWHSESWWWFCTSFIAARIHKREYMSLWLLDD